MCAEQERFTFSANWSSRTRIWFHLPESSEIPLQCSKSSKENEEEYENTSVFLL